MFPEWVGTLVFLTAVVLSGAKISRDIGDRGLIGYFMLLVLITVLSAAVGIAFI